jgi:hypothetical protein
LSVCAGISEEANLKEINFDVFCFAFEMLDLDSKERAIGSEE